LASIHNDTEIDPEFLKTCLIDAGKIALEQWGHVTASLKADLSPVTQVDRQVEDFLARRIAAQYPSHIILSEEGGAIRGGEAFTWVIDPIDGTRAYAARLPIWGVSIGVLRGNEPYLGGFYLPTTHELYWGTCQEAFYNGQKMNPPDTIDPASPLVFLAVPSDFHQNYALTYPRMRSLGSTAAHLAYTATGAAIGSLICPFSLWDLAGLLPILSAMGIAISFLSGEVFQASQFMDGRKSMEPILAAHPQVMAQLRSNIHPLNK
jgi:fructose-1,6-bisphosphatase/inositol monophosphatase family enzyme